MAQSVILPALCTKLVYGQWPPGGPILRCLMMDSWTACNSTQFSCLTISGFFCPHVWWPKLEFFKQNFPDLASRLWHSPYQKTNRLGGLYAEKQLTQVVFATFSKFQNGFIIIHTCYKTYNVMIYLTPGVTYMVFWVVSTKYAQNASSKIQNFTARGPFPGLVVSYSLF